MARNLSLIPTIEEGPLPAMPAAPVRAAPLHAARREERGRSSPPSAKPGNAGRPGRAARSRRRELMGAALIAAGIAVLFLAIAWPLYIWIGK